MKEQVKGILFDFKDAGWSVQKVEQELKFSNGSLGKVVNGAAGISEYRFSKLLELHQKEIKKTPTVTEGLAKQIAENNLPENKVKIEEKRNTNNVWGGSHPLTKSETLPPMPKREEFEDSIDFAAAKNEWKREYGNPL